jgi:hypothetical protein
MVSQCKTTANIKVIRFQALMVVSMKTTALWAVVPRNLMEVHKCFRGVYCPCHSEPLKRWVYFHKTTQRYIPENCHLYYKFLQRLIRSETYRAFRYRISPFLNTSVVRKCSIIRITEPAVNRNANCYWGSVKFVHPVTETCKTVQIANYFSVSHTY